MKPPVFAYEAPASLEEALGLMASHGTDARPLAGGQSLVPLLNFRLTSPAVLVDLNRIEALKHVRVTERGLEIGAMARQAELEGHADVAARWPILVEALRHVGHLQIRNRGTVGGSLAHNDPAAELPAVMVALDAVITAQRGQEARQIAAEEFFVSELTTALAEDELLTGIYVPPLPARAGWGFEEIARRHGDFALAAAAAILVPDRSGLSEARIVVTGVGGKAIRVRSAEKILIEGGATDAAIEEAAAAVAREIDPPDDVHATGAYRRQTAAVMTRRACHAARERARG